MKIAIIGSGVSGLSMAQLLKNEHEVDVFERKDKTGGLLHCKRVDGNLFHLVGGHVFNSKNKEVLDWFWSFFDKENEFLSAKRNAKILLKKNFLNYPIENSIYNLDDVTAQKIIKEILELYKNETEEPLTYSNFETFLKGNFGDTLFQTYFEPYNKKIWKRELSTIPLEWLEGKLPMPRYEEMITKNILRSDEENMVHNTFFYPKNNGSQFIIDRLSEGLNIIVSNEITSLSKFNDKWSVNNYQGYDHVIYTGDVRILSNVLKIDNAPLKDYSEKLSKLRSNGTSNILCECDENDISWLYMPGDETEAHRIIYTGNFSDTNNAVITGRKTCVVEFSGQVSDEEMKKQIKNLPGNLVPIATNHQLNSYIIHNKDTKSLIIEVKKELKPYGISLLGRFAEWEYFNMDSCIESAMRTKKEILK
jgi:protoporphyrinogen oxidase